MELARAVATGTSTKTETTIVECHRSTFRQGLLKLLLLHIVPVIAIAAVLTFFVIQYSLHAGKLSAPAGYDDISYMLDALERLSIAHKDGAGALIQNLVAQPLHAPWSTLAAMCAFALFGCHDWAPYTFNIVCPIVILATTGFLARRLPLWQRLLTLTYVASIQLVALSVYEFRPDFLSAFLIASGSTLTVLAPFQGKARSAFLFAGLAYGFALITKPSCFPFTLLMMGLAMSLSLARGYFLKTSAESEPTSASSSARSEDETPSRTCSLSNLARLLLPQLLLAGPYYLTAGKSTIEYIVRHNFSEAARIWEQRPETGLVDNLRFYLDGASAQWAFQTQLYPLLGLFALGLFVSLAVRHCSDAKWTALSLACLAAMSYLIVTINPVHGTFYGLPVFALGVCLAIHLIVSALTWANNRRPAIRIAVALIFTALVLSSWRSFNYPAYGATREAVQSDWQILHFLENTVTEQAPGNRPKVLFTTTGNVSFTLLRYALLKKGRDVFFTSPELMASTDAIIEQTNDYDLVVATDQSTPNIATYIPFTQKQDEVISSLRQSGKWRELSFFPDRDKGGFHVFVSLKPRRETARN